MDFSSLYSLMKRRHSARKFKDVPLDDAQVHGIIDAAVTAPSTLNTQPWTFIVVKDKGEKKRLREIYSDARNKLGLYEQDTSFVEAATPIVVVCEDSAPDKVMSCAMAIQNMLLAAEAMGLGGLVSVTIMLHQGTESSLMELLNVKQPRKIVLVTYFGLKGGEPQPKPKKETSGLVFTDRLA